MSKTHAGLNVYFKKNDVELNLYYNSLAEELKDKTSVVIINYKNSRAKHSSQPKEDLKQFGLTKDEIEKILLIKEFNVINPRKSIFELKYGIDSEAETKLKDIIHGNTDVKLTSLELEILNKSLKETILYNEYQDLPDEKKDLYKYKTTTDNDIIRETYKFINNMSVKYKEDMTYIAANANIYLHNAGVIFIAQQDMRKSKQITNLSVYKNREMYRGNTYNMTSIPITMLNKNFETMFVNFDEERFMTGLDKNILNDWNENLIREYDFILTYEAKKKIKELEEKAKEAILNGDNNPLTPNEIAIINMLKSICKQDENTPDMYAKDSYMYRQDLKSDYLTKLKRAKPKNISIDDLMYLLNFMLDKI